MSASTATWVLVADAHGARIFSFVDKHDGWALRETLKGDGSGHPEQTADFGAKASEHKGALHAHGESDPKQDAERRFAHTLSRVLERGHVQGDFAKLVLVAPPKLLGGLRENLNQGLQAAVVAELPKDYVHSDAKELARLIQPHLPV